MNSCCSDSLPSKSHNNSFQTVMNLRISCSSLKNTYEFLHIIKNSFRKFWHFWHDIIFSLAASAQWQTKCTTGIFVLCQIANNAVTRYTEYELPVSVVNKSVKPLWYCGINKNSRGKMHEIISVYHVFYTLGWEKSWPTHAPRAGVISIPLLTSKVRINFLFSILLPMKNELNKWNRQIKYFMNKLGSLSLLSLSPLEVTD